MKILAYNIHRSNQEKIDAILQRGADIMVLPECACPDQVSLPDGYEMTWVGQYDFKGLGVIWKSAGKCEVALWADDEHKYMIPLIVDGKWLLLTTWATMITGDFNCYID